MARLLAAVVSIGLAAGLIPAGVAAAAQRHSGDHRQWPGPGYAVEDVGPNTPVASAGARPGDRIMAIDGRDVNNSDDIDRAMQRSGHLVVVERVGHRLRLKIAPRALTPSEAQEYTVRSRRMLGIVEQRFILRPGTGANDVYSPRLSRRCRQRHLLR
jgi:membrane-associated protease RseP (regulator of RpoE activity)